MPRVRTRPINDYVQWLMDNICSEVVGDAQYCAKLECSEHRNKKGVQTLKELATITGIPYGTLLGWADMEGEHRFFVSILEAARLLKKSPEEIMLGLMGRAS